MSLPGWALPAVAAVIVGFGLFGVHSYVDNSYVDTNARSASKPVMPVFLPGDEGPSSAQQPSDAPTPTSLPTLTRSPSSGAAIMPTDRWTSEVMEAASRESSVEEPNEIDEPVEGDDLLRDASSERASLPEDSVPSEVEPPSFESTSPESTTAYSQTPAPASVDQYTGALSQQAPALTPPPDSPTSTETSLPPPADSPSLQDSDDNAGGSNNLKRVLLVEDPRTLGESLTMALQHQPDLEVVGRTSSATECRNFVAGEEGLDVAIVDLFLPDGQGIYLIEELRRSCPHVPVLVLTTSLDPRDHERAVEAGADAVLGKGAAPEEIVFTIRRLSHG